MPGTISAASTGRPATTAEGWEGASAVALPYGYALGGAVGVCVGSAVWECVGVTMAERTGVAEAAGFGGLDDELELHPEIAAPATAAAATIP